MAYSFRSAVRSAAAILAVILAGSAAGQPALDSLQEYPPPADEGEPLVFRMATDILPDSGVELANGVTVYSTDWATLMMVRIRLPSRDSTCTAALVGPRVALMAAHCVDAGGMPARVARTRVEIDTIRFEMRCAMHPEFAAADPRVRTPRSSQDYALCLIITPGAPPATLNRLLFEPLDLDAPLPVGTPVLMTGYGCDQMWIENNQIRRQPSDQAFRIGDAVISHPAGESEADRDYVSTLAGENDGVALCPGDSGGPLMIGASQANQTGRRRVVGVNSSIGLQDFGDGSVGYRSRMAALGTPAFRSFLASWLAENGSPDICGVNVLPGARQCRE